MSWRSFSSGRDPGSFRRALPGTYSLFTLLLYPPAGVGAFGPAGRRGQACAGLEAPGPARPRTPGHFLLVQKVTKDTPKGEAFRFASPFGIPLPSDQKGGLPPFWIFPRAWVGVESCSFFWRSLACAKMMLPASLLASGLCRWGRFCFSFSFWPVQKGELHTSGWAFDGAC